MSVKINGTTGYEYRLNAEGAVTTSVERKLGEFVSVKDFGAVGDGVADDTAAIQAAIDSLTQSTDSGVVYFPPNATSQFYKVTQPIVITKPVVLQGAGPAAVTVLGVGFSDGQAIFDFDNPVSSAYFFDVKDLTIRSDNSLPTGLRLRNCSYGNFENIQLYALKNGIKVTGTTCFTNNFYRVHTYQVVESGVIFDDYTGGGQHKFDGCTFNAGIGFSLKPNSVTDGLTFINCNFEQCGENEVYVGGTVNGLSIIGCRSEGLNAGTEILIYPTAGNSVGGLTITGCNFHADGGAVVPVMLGGAGGIVRGFSITGNKCGYVANPNFVVLNGDGESGLIAGNRTEYGVEVVNVKRPGVIVFGNEYAGGKNKESWGNERWGVTSGDWTPIDASGAGLAFPLVEAKYNKIGDVVHVWGFVRYPSTTNTSTAVIGGLPFAVAASSVPVTRAGFHIDYASQTIVNAIGGNSNSTGLTLFAGTVQATNAQASGSDFYFSGTYRAQ